MFEQENTPPENADEHVHLCIKRLPTYTGWFTKVRILINGRPFAKLGNGEECRGRISVGSTVDVEVVTFAWRNIWTIYITNDAEVNFGYSYWGSGFPFRYRNVKLRNYYGCQLVSTGLLRTRGQVIYNWFCAALLLLYVAAYMYPSVFGPYFPTH